MSRHQRPGAGRRINEKKKEDEVLYRDATLANLRKPGRYDRYFIVGALLAAWFAVVMSNLPPGGGAQNVLKTALIMTNIAIRPALMVIDWPLQVIATTNRVVHELSCAAGLHQICHNPCRDHEQEQGFIDVFAHLVYLLELGPYADSWWVPYLNISSDPPFRPLYALPTIKQRARALYQWVESTDSDNNKIMSGIVVTTTNITDRAHQKVGYFAARRLVACHESELLINLMWAAVPCFAAIMGLF